MRSKSASSLETALAAAMHEGHCGETNMQTNMQKSLNLSAHDPDGVPHEIVGLTWLFTLAAAIFSFAALASGSPVAVFALLAIPSLIIALSRRAERRRVAQA